MTNIVFYDGDCAFCSASVRFIKKRLWRPYDMQFVSQHSPEAQTHLQPYFPNEIPKSSLLFLSNTTLYSESDAVLQITKYLHYPWRLAHAFRFIPQGIRHSIYRFIAKHRHQLWRSQEACILPNPQNKFE
jgi:predicted DCC family thiol-disulfide oxidoreductase YuxK